jgi:hypothetical protein
VAGPGTPAGAAQWSAPLLLSSCPVASGPRVVFPSERAETGTGPGAIVWSAGPGCPGGPGARVDAISSQDVPLAPAPPHRATGAPLAPRGELAVATGPHGQVVIAGASPWSSSQTLVVQGRSTGPFRTLARFAGSVGPASLNTAWLGDVAVAADAPAGGLFLRIERFFANVLGPARQIAQASSGTSALTVAMDFRSDAVAAWAQGGRILVHPLPARGPRHGISTLGPAGQDPHIALLISDDYRSIVMWSDRQGRQSSIYLDYSAPGLSFGPPLLLERFTVPPGPAPAASPLLVRLSSESVMAAWAAAQDGRWVIRTAPIDQHGLRTVSTIASPGGGPALLDDLSAGPRDEAMLLLTEPSQGATQTLLAARGVDEAPGRTAFSIPQPIYTGSVEDAAIAVDPDTDRPVAAWHTAAGDVEAAVGSPAGG